MGVAIPWTANTGKARTLRSALAGAFLLALPACGIPGLRPAQSSPDLPPAFDVPATGAATPGSPQVPAPLGSVVGGAALGPTATVPAAAPALTSLDSSGRLCVNEFYTDPILVGLLNEAVANNQELRILNEEVMIAQNEILARKGAYFPFVSVGGRTGFDRSSRFTRDGAVDEALSIPPNGRIYNPLPMSGIGLDLSWTPDIFRALRNARDAAAQRYYAANERRNFFVTRLVAEVAERYYTLASLDARLRVLDQTIALQERSLEVAAAKQKAGRDSSLPVYRFQAEVQRNQSEKLVVAQEIVEAQNRINVLLNRFPGPVERTSGNFIDLELTALSVGLPSQLLQNRADIRQAERELAANGLDVQVARARFYPAFVITAGIGYEAFNPRYFFDINALVANAAGSLVAPLLNKAAIKADYMTANARQLQSLYDYQRTVVNAVTEVANRVTAVENYRRSIEIKRQQLQSLEASVDTATKLFNAPRENANVDYIDVLLAQRDLLEARASLIQTKREQLAAVVNAYQALGGGGVSNPPAVASVGPVAVQP